MTKKHSTKRALIASILALCMCFTMLIGTTFAWFTDSVTSSGNVIQTGKLDVAMYWAEGNEDPAAVSEWKDASTGAIFNNDKWEPGYSEAKHIKIANEGTLALKYQMRIIANGVVSELANVIDVYYFDDATQLDRASFVEANKLGTLAEVLNVTYDKNISKTISGSLEEGTSKTVTLAFKMQESAGNEYQEMSIGADFSIQLLATQYTSEEDSFNNQYDADADFDSQEVPAAMVYALSQSKLQTITIGGFDTTLDTGYSFQPTETFEQASAGDYEWAHADFFVYADATVPANSMALAGYYTAFEGFSWEGQTLSDTTWIGLSADADIAAGEANGIRLLANGMGLSIAYSEICNYGNDGTGFLCGAADLTGENEGTTLYVELRVYKTECDDPGCHHNKAECETGEYITIGKFQYTFDSPEFTRLDDGSLIQYGENGALILADVSTVEADTYYIPDGITAIGDYAFTGNDTITEVVVSDTVTSLGRAFDSNTSIKKVTLNEGLETIDSRAFRSTTALEEVVISSTVTTIADNAFQKSGIKNIVIPATVETIGETAFGASLIETVTFEGNTAIEGYAFRGCTKLHTVTMKGDDNKFVASSLNGRNSMWFCNGESNNPNTSDIDFYVTNSTVASRIKTAMGAEAGNTDVYINGELASIKNVATLAKFQEALDAAVDGDIICFTANITGDAVVNQPGDADVNLVINGCGYKYDGSIQIKGGSDFDGEDNDSLLIENINFETSNSSTTNGRDAFVWSADSSNGSYWRYAHNVTVDNCTFTAVAGSAAEKAFVGVKFQQAYNITVTNCVATNMHSLLQAESCDTTVTVDYCEVVNCKNGVSLNNTRNAVVKNTVIESVVDGGYGIRHKGQQNNYQLTVENCTIEAFVPVLVRNMTGSGYKATFSGNVELTATNDLGYEVVVSAGDWDNDSAAPSAPTGTYTLVGADSFTKNVD